MNSLRPGPHISYRAYPDRTILIDHRTATTYELNDAAAATLDRLERGEAPTADETEFVAELHALGVFDPAPGPIRADRPTAGAAPATDEIFTALKRYGEQHCIPIAATFSVTYRCPLACRHCFFDKKPATGDGELTLGEIEHILDQLREAGTLYLTLTGGEPFLRSDLLDIVAAARRRRFAVSILTSGYLCDDRTLDALATLWPESVQVSLYGPNAATHDHFTGVNGSFERAIGALRGLRDRGIAVTAAVSINTATAPTVRELTALMATERIPLSCNLTMLPARSGTTDPTALNLPEEELAALIADLAIPHGDRLAGKAPDDPPCAAARSVVALDPYGTVLPCHELDLSAGSLREKPFAELWRALPFENLRLLRFGDLADCPDCPYRAVCGRCTALALRTGAALTGHAALDCRTARAFFRDSQKSV
ncbi:MAG TPA: radical SAM protein [bacterium]|nr:radical SAM protein [bacterium]